MSNVTIIDYQSFTNTCKWHFFTIFVKSKTFRDGNIDNRLLNPFYLTPDWISIYSSKAGYRLGLDNLCRNICNCL